jgi:hypothetical protein
MQIKGKAKKVVDFLAKHFNLYDFIVIGAIAFIVINGILVEKQRKLEGEENYLRGYADGMKFSLNPEHEVAPPMKGKK